jgi:hypothetical protein
LKAHRFGPGLPLGIPADPAARRLVGHVEHKFFLAKFWAGTGSTQAVPGINDYLLPQVIFGGQRRLVDGKQLAALLGAPFGWRRT